MTDTRTTRKSTTTKPQTGVNVLLPSALHKRLRVKAFNEGLTMAEAIQAAVREWLR
jgi:post-segregation antitoxin (ccd killing protein)